MPIFTGKRVIAMVVGLFFLAAVFLSLGLGLFLVSPAEKGGKDQVVVVKEGLSLGQVAEALKDKRTITNKSLFMFFESWEKKSDLEQHLQKPHIKSFMDKTYELLAEPVSISLWEKVDG